MDIHTGVICVKKALCLILIGLLIGAVALADVPQLSDNLFASAKQAVGYLASGEYERMVTLLPFSDVAPSAQEWESFSSNYANLEDVQSDYAVGFWTGGMWVVAVPIQVPENGDVEVLALSSEDGASFTGYRYATWAQVESACNSSDRVVWNVEYIDGVPTLLAD